MKFLRILIMCVIQIVQTKNVEMMSVEDFVVIALKGVFVFMVHVICCTHMWVVMLMMDPHVIFLLTNMMALITLNKYHLYVGDAVILMNILEFNIQINVFVEILMEMILQVPFQEVSVICHVVVIQVLCVAQD